MRITGFLSEPFERLVYHSPSKNGGPEEFRLPFFRATVDSLPGGVEAIVALADLQGYEIAPGGQAARLAGERVIEELAAMSELGMIPPLGRCGIIVAGDMHSEPDCAKRGGCGDVRSAWLALARKAAWLVGVAGNHDLFGDRPQDLEDFRKEPRVHFLHGEVADIGGLRIAGMGGVIGNPRKPFRWTPEAYAPQVCSLLKAQPEIFILHEPPGAPGTARNGNPVVEQAFAKAGGPLVICGHKHWDNPLAELPGGVQVLNVHERVVILEKGPVQVTL